MPSKEPEVILLADPIAHHALRQPEAPAIALPYADISYGAFNAAINAVANHLATITGPGARVALAVDDPYIAWVLMFALGRIGAISASVELGKHDLYLPGLQPSLVLTDKGIEGPYAAMAVKTDLAWLNDLVADGNKAPVSLLRSLDSAARISMSSGTTGTPKLVQLTHEQVQRRIKSGIFSEPGRVYERVLCMIGPGALGGYVATQRTWWAGGVVCMFVAMPQLIAHRKVSGIIASPRQIVGVLDRLPPTYQRLPDLRLMIGGSRIPRVIREALLERLAGHATNTYGATEIGAVANAPFHLIEQYGDATAGLLLPWVQAEAVDENGVSLPAGAEGEIRLRSPEMIHGYMDDPEATARHFRDGWFHPGDVGSVSAEGVLTIVGRVDDVANIGGVKVAPEVIEGILRDVEGIDDVGVFMSDVDGVTRVYAAIVPAGKPDIEEAHRRVATQMPGGSVPLTFLPVAEIPRNQMGKVQRKELRALVTAAMTADATNVH